MTVQPLPWAREDVNRLKSLMSYALFPLSGLSASSMHRSKTGAGQDAGDYISLVTLNFDPTLLHRASCTTGFLHFPSESLFLSQTNANETRDNRHCLAASVRGLATDIHPPTALLRC